MTEPLTNCFQYILPFQKVERFEGVVPWNVPPFQVERKVEDFPVNLLFCNNKKWNVPDYFLGTRAYRSTQHSLLESVWKLDGPLGNKVFVTPLTKLCWLDNECASRVPAVGCNLKNLVAGCPIFYSVLYDVQNALVKVIWMDKNRIYIRVNLHALQPSLVRLGAGHGLDENITEAEVMGVMALSIDSYVEGRALIIPRYSLLISLKAQICARDFQFSFRIVLRFFNISPATVECVVYNKHIHRRQVFKACALRNKEPVVCPAPAGHHQAQYQSKSSHRCQHTHVAASGNPNVKNNHERKENE